MNLDLEEFKELGLDNDEIEAFLEAFKLFDADNSNSISVSELKSVLKALGKDLTDEQIRVMMASTDKDGN